MAPSPSRSRKPAKTVRKTAAKPDTAARPTRLAGGNPRIAKGEGDGPVQAYIAAMPGWKQAIGRRLDDLIVRTVPGVRKAVKWNTPFYGRDGKTWFVGYHCLTASVKVAFPMGAHLKPVPPGASKQQHVRYLDIREGDALDEQLIASWIAQAAALPGEAL